MGSGSGVIGLGETSASSTSTFAKSESIPLTAVAMLAVVSMHRFP